ncbi:putative type-1 restriction enzyme HindVIIP specificity protein (plasmid) [Arthrobacter sp. Hiyo8]|uniref:restriction endonuclease subunit S n=1 Tax=Arthrobacter sp. Hiyo1 TaxID=1588020 RepID=UPI000683B356|nr:restriction endonuclease subunit S [Arthrobacter sp. Hiyo1]BAS18315.1 putative type-1 restriction enzyme HindVIIP specificity protein [Arthrobacter sp. Hiyo8]GAP60845.1 putative type-1 restriction enzyme HindVIIP specificity protein [Arthrobacter sp. Hiyo1]
MSAWRSATIESLASGKKSALSTGPFGSAVASKNFRQSGVPMLRGSNLSDDVGTKLDERDLVFLDPDLAATFERSTARQGDLVFTCWGSVGQIGLIDAAAQYGEYIVSNKQMKLSPDPGQVDSLFLYYNMSQPKMIFEVQSQAIGSTIPGFNLGQLRALTVQIPELAEQRAIADVLGALDEKIAANTKIAATTDEILSARFSALSEAETDEVRLGDIADVNVETVKPVAGGQLRYIDIASVDVGSFNFPALTGWDTAPSRARRRVTRGDTIWSTVRPNRRSHALNLSDDSLLVGSTGLAVISPRTVGFAYVYEVTKMPEFTAYLETVAEGSAYPAVRADRFSEAPVPLLCEDARGSFEALAAPLRESVHALEIENRILAATRDALLPQLMSGKLRVKDAEKALESAGV